MACRVQSHSAQHARRLIAQPGSHPRMSRFMQTQSKQQIHNFKKNFQSSQVHPLYFNPRIRTVNLSRWVWIPVALLLSVHVLGNRQDISIRVLKPGDSIAAGSRPDLFLHPWILFEDNTSLLQPASDLVDRLHLPPQNRVRCGNRFLNLNNPNHVVVCFDNQGKLVMADEFEPQHIHKELPRPVVIPSRQKTDQFASR